MSMIPGLVATYGPSIWNKASAMYKGYKQNGLKGVWDALTEEKVPEVTVFPASQRTYPAVVNSMVPYKNDYVRGTDTVSN